MSFTNNIKNSVYSIEGDKLIIKPNREQYLYYLPSPLRNQAIRIKDTDTYLTATETILTGTESWTFTIDPTKDYESDFLFCVWKSSSKQFIYDTDCLIGCKCGVQSGYPSFARPFEFTPTILNSNFDNIKWRNNQTNSNQYYFIYWYTQDNVERISGLPILRSDDKPTSNITKVYTANWQTLNAPKGIFMVRQLKSQSTITMNVRINGTFEHCTCNYSNNDIIQSNKPIIITANTDYEFSSDTYVANIYNGSTLIQNVNFDNNADRNILTLNIGSWYGRGDTIVLQASMFTPVKEPPKSILTQWVRLYAPTNDEMNDLASEAKGLEWLLGFYYLPFDISSYLSTEKKAVKMGVAISTKTVAYEYLYWSMSIDGGELFIPEKYQNVYDYKFVDVSLHIPFFGEIKLDTDLIMNSTLKLTYEINLYQGLATAIITRFNDTIPIYQTTKKVGYYTPVVTTWVGLSDTTLSIPFMEKNFYFSALIKRNVPYPDSGFYGKVNKFYSKLSDLTGYTVVTEIQLDDTIPYDMQSEIKQLLGRGVFV